MTGPHQRILLTAIAETKGTITMVDANPRFPPAYKDELCEGLAGQLIRLRRRLAWAQWLDSREGSDATSDA